MAVKITRGPYIPPPEGMHNAVCVDVVDLGDEDTPFGKKRKVRFVWEIDAQMDDGRRFTVRKKYTASLHEMSTLHKDLKGWRGRPFTPEELIDFDLEMLVGTPCRIVVQHGEHNGNVFANVTTVLKADPQSHLQPSGAYKRRESVFGSVGGEVA